MLNGLISFVGAVDELGDMPYYAEHCAAMLAVTYSSGQGMQRNIVSKQLFSESIFIELYRMCLFGKRGIRISWISCQL